MRTRRRTFGIKPSSRVLFLTPRKALARQVTFRLKQVFTRTSSIPVYLVTRDADADTIVTASPAIGVSSPNPLLRRLRREPTPFPSLDLIVAHDLHALDPAYELVLSRLRWAYPGVRIVGSSASLADATSLADWLDVPEHATYSFSPGTRTTSLTTNLQPFTTPHSFALLRQMVKPAYDAMRTASGGTIAFVPSRSQCRATAKDLVTQSASDLESSFVADGALETVATYAETVTDPDLAEALTHGIAVFHEGLPAAEQRLALELFGSGVVRVLVASREACWTLPVRASLVVLMSAQYVALRPGADEGRDEREVQDYAMPEVLQMQSLAVPPSPESSAEFLVLCQKDQSELYDKFLQHGVVLESALPLDPLLAAAAFGDIVDGRVKDRQDLVDLLSWTLASRRLEANPSYYLPDLSTPSSSSEGLLSRLADSVVDELERRCAVLPSGRTDFALSLLGQYYAAHGVSLEEVERLQGLELAELVKGAGGGKAPKKRAPAAAHLKVNGDASADAGATDGAAEDAPPRQKHETDREPLAQDPILSAFHQRLPRVVKNAVGERGEVELAEWERRVLLGAFRAGRVPRGKGGLEEKQRDLVELVVKSRV